MCCTSVPPGWFQGARTACASSNNIPFTCTYVRLYIHKYILHYTYYHAVLSSIRLLSLARTRDILRRLLGKSLACSCLIPAHRVSSYNLRLGRCVNGAWTNHLQQVRRSSKRCETDHQVCYPRTAVEMWQ